MTKLTLKAENRKIVGRKTKKLRRDGIVPANIYGKNVKSQTIQVAEDEFKVMFKEAGETGVVSLILGKDTKPTLIHEVQVHPTSDAILHVDFLQVDLKEKVHATVPVELIGESPAEKSGLGTVVLLLNELEVEALPTDLPEKFVVDISRLTEVDQAVKVVDLDYDKKQVEIKMDENELVAKVEPPQKEEVVVAPVVEPVEGEAVPAAEGEPTKEGEVPKQEKEEKPSES